MSWRGSPGEKPKPIERAPLAKGPGPARELRPLHARDTSIMMKFVVEITGI